MDTLPVGGGIKNVAQQRCQQRFKREVQIRGVRPGVRQQQGRFFLFASRQRHRFAARQLAQRRGHLLQNDAVRRIPRAGLRQGCRKRAEVQIVRQRRERGGKLQTPGGRGLFRLKQRGQMIAVKGGGHQGLPRLRVIGYLWAGAGRLLIQRLKLGELFGNFFESWRRIGVRPGEKRRHPAEQEHHSRFELVAGKSLLKTGVDQQRDHDGEVDDHP
ncbi:Uncharacterised protein [Raoultella ornithinolytica]|nr:Uncharacterised protein [Raoultella ornithinolytica]